MVVQITHQLHKVRISPIFHKRTIGGWIDQPSQGYHFCSTRWILIWAKLDKSEIHSDKKIECRVYDGYTIINTVELNNFRKCTTCAHYLIP